MQLDLLLANNDNQARTKENHVNPQGTADSKSEGKDTEEDNPKRKVLKIQQRLCQEYGCPIPYFHTLDPLSELISALLSHRTKNKDSGRAFKQLIAAFPSWGTVRDAETAAVQAVIAPCTWPEQKAPRIQQVLQQIKDKKTAGEDTSAL